MQITPAQYERIAHCFPKPSGKLVYSNLEALNAILYVTENGIKWRRLPKYYGNWHTIYMRMRGWAKAGVLARAFTALRWWVSLKGRSKTSNTTSVRVTIPRENTLTPEAIKSLFDCQKFEPQPRSS